MSVVSGRLVAGMPPWGQPSALDSEVAQLANPPGIDKSPAGTAKSGFQRRGPRMAEEIAGAETVRVIDPDNVGEIFVTGGCNVSRAGNYIKILLTVSREDPEALMANRMQAPSLVVVSRAIMEAGTALALA